MSDDRYRRYRERHPERVREAQRRWREAHPDYKRAYRIANGDRLRAQEKTWRDGAGAEKRGQRRRAWRQAERVRNYDKIRARENAYQLAHPEFMAEYKRRHKARKRGAVGVHHTVAEWREKLELFANLCAYCGLPKKLERDHNIPLSRGGSDEISNIIPACRMCNLHKSARTSREYLESLRNVS